MTEIANEVPAPPSPFVGRQQELDFLRRVVRPGTTVALTSPGGTDGVGKTALAQAYAARASGEVAAVLGWSVPLDGPRPHGALRRWAALAGVDVEGVTTLSGLVEAARAGIARLGRVLVVLDGIDLPHVAAAREVIAAVGDHGAVLVTAEHEAVPRELRARAVLVEPLLEEEAEELLAVLAGSAVPPVLAQATFQLVAHNSLGLRLMGSAWRLASADESTGIFGGADPKRVSRLGGPVGVARAFLHAFRRTTEDDARAFRALGVTVHGAVDAPRLAPLLDAPEDVVRGWLDHLAALGLIEADGPERFRVHPLMRRYAEVLAGEARELDLLRARRLTVALSRPDLARAGSSLVVDAVEDALARDVSDDVIALAVRLGEPLSAWSFEAARELLGRGVQIAEGSGHRARAVLRARFDALLAKGEDEDELELELEPLDETEETDDGALDPDDLRTQIATQADVREALRRARAARDTGAGEDGFLRDRGLLVGPVTPARAAPPTGRAPRRPPDLLDSRRRAARAAADALGQHERMLGAVRGLRVEVGRADDPRVHEAFAVLLDAGARLTAAVREAEAARLGADAAEDPVDAAQLAGRAVEAAERANRIAGEVDAAASDVHEALAAVHEGRARREVAGQEVRRSVLRAAQALADARRRLASRRASLDGADPTLFVRADELVAEAQLAADELDELARRVASGAVPVEAARRAEDLVARVEEAAREAVVEANRRLEARRDGRRLATLQEAREHAERAAREAARAHDLCTEIRTMVQDATDAEGLRLAGRAERIAVEVNRRRAELDEALGRLERGGGGDFAEEAALVQAAAGGVRAALADAEHARAEADAWAAAHDAEVTGDLALASVHAEAARTMAAIESAGAVARRALSRAWQALAGLEDVQLASLVERVREAERQLRTGREAARLALREVLACGEPGAALERRAAAEDPIRRADAAAEQARQLADRVLASAEALRADTLDAHRRRGAEIAAGIERVIEQIEEAAAEARRLAAHLPDEAADLAAIETAVEEAARAAEIAGAELARLQNARDTLLASRLVDAIAEQADLATEALLAVETGRDTVRDAWEAGVEASPADGVRLADEARALVAAVRAELEDLRAGTPSELAPMLARALVEAGAELEQAATLVDELPERADDPAWSALADEEVVERVEAVRRLVERARQGIGSARTLVDAVLARRARAAEPAASAPASTAPEPPPPRREPPPLPPRSARPAVEVAAPAVDDGAPATPDALVVEPAEVHTVAEVGDEADGLPEVEEIPTLVVPPPTLDTRPPPPGVEDEAEITWEEPSGVEPAPRPVPVVAAAEDEEDEEEPTAIVSRSSAEPHLADRVESAARSAEEAAHRAAERAALLADEAAHARAGKRRATEEAARRAAEEAARLAREEAERVDAEEAARLAEAEEEAAEAALRLEEAERRALRVRAEELLEAARRAAARIAELDAAAPDLPGSAARAELDEAVTEAAALLAEAERHREEAEAGDLFDVDALAAVGETLAGLVVRANAAAVALEDEAERRAREARAPQRGGPRAEVASGGAADAGAGVGGGAEPPAAVPDRTPAPDLRAVHEELRAVAREQEALASRLTALRRRAGRRAPRLAEDAVADALARAGTALDEARRVDPSQAPAALARAREALAAASRAEAVLREAIERAVPEHRPDEVPVVAPRPATEAREALAHRRAGRPAAALDAALRALNGVEDLDDPDGRAALWLQAAHAYLGVGRAASARACLDAAEGLARDPGVRRAVERLRRLAAHGVAPIATPASAWTASAHEIRRWRRRPRR